MPASSVTFDILLGGRVTPEALKALNDMEAHLKKFGATTKTINAVMSRAYKETFDGVAKNGEEAFNKVEKSSREAFRKMVDRAKESEKKIKESFARVGESYKSLAETLKKPLEFLGITSALGAVGGVFGGGFALAEITKEGMKAYGATQERQDALRAALRGRGREDLFESYVRAAEELRRTTPVSEEFALGKLSKMAASGKYRSGEEAERMLRSLIAVGGGTEAGAEQAISAYSRATATGKINARSLAMIGRGSGFSVLKQISRDTGIPMNELQAAFSDQPAKVSARTGQILGDPMKGAIGSVKAIELVKKAILELGEGPAAGIIEAKMNSWTGLIDQLTKGWDKFTEQIGHFWIEVLSPLIRDIDKWLATIDWEATFSKLIEKGREFGQTLVNIYHSLQNTPVVAQIRKIFDDIWRAMTGGIDMYGPVVEAWNDNLNHAMGTHFERQLTPAGRKWIEQTSGVISGVLQKITDALQWFIDHPDDVKKWFDGIIEACKVLIELKVLKFFTDLSLGFTALGSNPVVASILAMAYGAQLTKAGVEALKTPEGQKLAQDLERARMHPGDSQEEHDRGVRENMDKWFKEQPWYTPSGASGSSSEEMDILLKATQAQKDQTESLKKLDELNERVRKTQELHNKAIQDATGALQGHSPGFTPAVVDATTQLNAFVPAINAAMQGMTSMQFGLGAGGGYAGGPTGPHETEYGPAVPGDQPGGPTYDYNSYHHIGAWPSITGPLRMGDVALGYGAQAQYHVMPGQRFTTASGHYVRFADRSGSKDPYNIDYFRGALGGVVNRPTRALLGEAGPEMVLPLTGSLMSKLGHTVNLSFGNISFGGGESRDGTAFIREFAETIASEVKRVIETENRRSAVV
jgi:tape measure domain-containing protein